MTAACVCVVGGYEPTRQGYISYSRSAVMRRVLVWDFRTAVRYISNALVVTG